MINLPPIINTKIFSTIDSQLKEAYRIFEHDFINYPPKFKGTIIKTRNEVTSAGYNKTFWHVVTEGDHAENDKIKLDRLVRIPWINPIIEGQPDSDWLLWVEPRFKNRSRIHIYSIKWKYLIVIEQSNNEVSEKYFWTAFPLNCTTDLHEERKLISRYKKYHS